MDKVKKLKDEGFKGFVRVEELMSNPKLPEDEKGVYVVLYTHDTRPDFMQVGTGGFFKDEDPSPPWNRHRAWRRSPGPARKAARPWQFRIPSPRASP